MSIHSREGGAEDGRVTLIRLSVFEWGNDGPDGRLRDRRLVSSERAERVSVCEEWARETEGGR